MGNIKTKRVEQSVDLPRKLIKPIWTISIGFVAAISALSCSPDPQGELSALKTIQYNDGALTFQIPSHWTEDYEDDGHGEFYDPDDGDRTFRLTLHIFQADSSKPLEHPRTFLEALAKKFGGAVIELGNGYYFNSHERHYEENGEALTNRFWLLARMITDTESQMASFTYTYPDSLGEAPQTIEEMKILEGLVKEAHFFDIANPSGGEQAAAPGP